MKEVSEFCEDLFNVGKKRMTERAWQSRAVGRLRLVTANPFLTSKLSGFSFWLSSERVDAKNNSCVSGAMLFSSLC